MKKHPIFDFGPNIGYTTCEPTLRELVYRYYLAHFCHDDAVEYCRCYFLEISKREAK